MKIGNRVMVISVEESKESLRAFALRYGIEDAKEIFDYDKVKYEIGTVTGLGENGNVFVNLDNWIRDITFKESELEVLS